MNAELGTAERAFEVARSMDRDLVEDQTEARVWLTSKHGLDQRVVEPSAPEMHVVSSARGHSCHRAPHVAGTQHHDSHECEDRTAAAQCGTLPYRSASRSWPPKLQLDSAVCMSDTRKHVSRALAVAGMVAATTVSSVLHATGARVALGEVTTRVVRSDVDLGEVLRDAVRVELVSLETPHAERGPLILSASLVRMDTDGAKVTCVVSAMLRTARGGTMLAIVEGKAGVVTEAPLTPGLARQAVAAAARAAVVRVPDALR
jgi:hypothetical protein